MTLAVETVEINGKDVELYKITGHPVEDLVVLARNISSADAARLIEAATGDLKANDETLIDGVEATGIALNLLQAVYTDIGRSPFQLYAGVFQSLADVTKVITKADISTNTAQHIYDIKESGGDSGLAATVAALTLRIEALELAATET